MAHNPLENNNSGQAMPGVTGETDVALNTEEYQYRVNRFVICEGDDDTLAMEALLTRSLTEDVIVVERKDAISSVSGDYICVVIYMEKRL